MQMLTTDFKSLFEQLPGVFTRRLIAGDILFRQGDPAEHVFSVESGALRLVRYTTDGHAVCLHTARNGDSFAEAALFTDQYHCNGEALKDTLVWCYPCSEVLRRLAEDTRSMEQVFELMATQVRYLRLLLELRGVRSAPERIMQLFRLRADSSGMVHFTDSLLATAQELGLAHETFYRALSLLEKQGEIKRLDPRTIRLLSVGW
jgi:CRP-like cAMP-binding protein